MIKIKSAPKIVTKEDLLANPRVLYKIDVIYTNRYLCNIDDKIVYLDSETIGVANDVWLNYRLDKTKFRIEDVEFSTYNYGRYFYYSPLEVFNAYEKRVVPREPNMELDYLKSIRLP